MSDPDSISFHDFVICKNCTRAFTLAQSHSSTLHGVKFPNRDASIIEAQCPRCRVERTYYNKDLWKDDDEEGEVVKQLRSQLAQVTTEKDVLKRMYEELLLKVGQIVHDSKPIEKSKNPQMEPVG